jgi:protein-S-isoprenylcysteine O-methyltransferase Ste14
MTRTSLYLGDFFAKVLLIGFLTFVTVIQSFRAFATLQNAPGDAHEVVRILSYFAVLFFLGLLIATTLLRHKPLASSNGLEARASAFAGTFLVGLVPLLPEAALPSTALAVSLLLISGGGLLSAYVLAWLGRSFSITAQARRLVTTGPYALVRHPLYVAEEITTIGVVILHFSWLAVGIAALHWLSQLRRMRNEERILAATFPEYVDYAKQTPLIVPSVLRTPVGSQTRQSNR